MKISLNWLKKYTDIHLSPDKLSEALTDIGLEVEGYEEVESIAGGLKGFVTGQVLTCERFEVKEKMLSLCTVDLGNGGEPAQIVCGAANVEAGQKVIVATVGTTLYKEDGSPLFKIDRKKTYGYFSEGMICAEDELGIGTSHDGIMVLPADTALGIPAAQYFNLTSDVVYEIGLTPNRSDATCHVGVAQDLAAVLKVNYKHSGEVTKPSIETFSAKKGVKVEVSVANTEACPRYSGVLISGIKVAESPKWLKDSLTAVGMNTRNNIVDITNFIMHELGQPLHAFDWAQVAGQKIVVKNVEEGTKFLSLKKNEQGENVELSLNSEDLLICDADGKPMCIAGVIGSPTSGVSDDTTTIFLEAAYFHAKNTRRSATRHNTRTDSSKVFEKGSDPNNTLYALKRAALLIQELAGGDIASEVVDIYPTPIEPKRITVAYKNITRLIGEELPKETIEEILSALNIKQLSKGGADFVAVIPTNKVDVVREADVVEEILRIYGFNRVPVPSQIKSAMTIGAKPDPIQIRNLIGDLLAANGFNEMMGISLSKSMYYKEILPLPDENLVYVNNTANVHLDSMRATMLFSGLEAIERNQNRQNADVRLFEFGKTYLKKDEKNFDEKQHLTLFMSGKRYSESWLTQDKGQVTYYTLKAYVQNILTRLGISNYQETVLSDGQFNFGLCYHQGPKVLVEFGKIQASILKKMDIKNPVFYADFQWDTLFSTLKKHKVTFEELSKFHVVRRDLALILENSINFTDIAAIARKAVKNALKEVNLFDVYINKDQLGETKKSCSVSFLFENKERTLQDKEIDAWMSELIKQYEEKLGATIRK
jgi:phenylalanyl-tRNA synthetase beta chain